MVGLQPAPEQADDLRHGLFARVRQREVLGGRAGLRFKGRKHKQTQRALGVLVQRVVVAGGGGEEVCHNIGWGKNGWGGNFIFSWTLRRSLPTREKKKTARRERRGAARRLLRHRARLVRDTRATRAILTHAPCAPLPQFPRDMCCCQKKNQGLAVCVVCVVRAPSPGRCPA